MTSTDLKPTLAVRLIAVDWSQPCSVQQTLLRLGLLIIHTGNGSPWAYYADNPQSIFLLRRRSPWILVVTTPPSQNIFWRFWYFDRWHGDAQMICHNNRNRLSLICISRSGDCAHFQKVILGIRCIIRSAHQLGVFILNVALPEDT